MLLSPGEIGTLYTNPSIQPLGETLYNLPTLGKIEGTPDLFFGSIRGTIRHIVAQRRVKEFPILENKRYGIHKVVRSHLAYIHAPNRDTPLRHIIEARDKASNCTLTPSRGSYQSIRFPFRQGKRELLHGRGIGTGIGKGNALEGNTIRGYWLWVLSFGERGILRKSLHAVDRLPCHKHTLL